MDNKGKKEFREMGILRWLLVELCRQCFHDNAQTMALVLGVRKGEIERALAHEGARSGIRAFEEGVKYCLRHNISIDDLMCGYPGNDK